MTPSRREDSTSGATDWERLYHEYSADVRRFAFWLSGDAAAADDITSETFVRAWAGTGEIRAATAKAYLITIARNLFRSEWRRKRRDADLDPDTADPRPGPEETVMRGRELERALLALRELPEEDRAALLMRAESHLGYEEIGRALGMSAGAVRVRVHRARRKLKQLRQGEES